MAQNRAVSCRAESRVLPSPADFFYDAGGNRRGGHGIGVAAAGCARPHPCSRPTGAAWPPGAHAQSVLRIGLQDDPDVFDPARAYSFVGRIVLTSLCNKLIDVDPDLNFVPQLALSWDTAPDGRSVTFKLRPGREILGRHRSRRRCRRLQPRPRPAICRQPAAIGDPGDRHDRGGRSAHGQAQPEDALRAADRAALGSRRADRLAEGAAEPGRVRRRARLLRAVQVRRAHRAGPHHPAARSGLLGPRPTTISIGSSSTSSPTHGAARRSARRLARFRRAHPGERRRRAEAGQALQGDGRSEPAVQRHHLQHGERRRRQPRFPEASRAARGARSRDRPRCHQPGDVRRQRDDGQPGGAACEPVLREGPPACARTPIRTARARARAGRAASRIRDSS